MIYTEEAVFIHVPKTGGMSVTRFLVNALDNPVTVVAPANAKAHSLNLAASPQAAAKLSHSEGDRHETCPEAVALIKAQGWQMPQFAFAMIRHPVDMLLSYYKHMRKPHVWKRMGMTIDTLWGAPKQAMESSFDVFSRQRGYYGMTDNTVLDYYRPSGFERLDVVPLEHIAEYLPHRFSHHQAFGSQTLEHRNKSTEKLSTQEVSEETAGYICDTYPGLTRLYEDVARTKPWLQS